MTIRADRALSSCDAIVGYPVYVDLVKDRYPGKALFETPMTQEARRCQLALDLAREGKQVCIVCSGDSGIYGMAALVYELRGECVEPEIEVVPGLTAACSGGAVLGAPLTHDFAVISLSDRLTPWETIESGCWPRRAFFDRHLQPREPRTARAFKTGVRGSSSRAARDAPLRHCPQYRPRRREPPDPDAGRAPGRAGRHVLHSLHRKQRGEGAIRQSRNAERVPRCLKFAFSAARPRAGSSPSF